MVNFKIHHYLHHQNIQTDIPWHLGSCQISKLLYSYKWISQISWIIQVCILTQQPNTGTSLCMNERWAFNVANIVLKNRHVGSLVLCHFSSKHWLTLLNLWILSLQASFPQTVESTGKSDSLSVVTFYQAGSFLHKPELERWQYIHQKTNPWIIRGENVRCEYWAGNYSVELWLIKCFEWAFMWW